MGLFPYRVSLLILIFDPFPCRVLFPVCLHPSEAASLLPAGVLENAGTGGEPGAPAPRGTGWAAPGLHSHRLFW